LAQKLVKDFRLVQVQVMARLVDCGDSTGPRNKVPSLYSMMRAHPVMRSIEEGRGHLQLLQGQWHFGIGTREEKSRDGRLPASSEGCDIVNVLLEELPLL